MELNPAGDNGDRLQAIQEHQLALIQAAHPDIAVAAEDGSGPREPGQPFGFLFRDHQLLVRPDVVEQVLELVRARVKAAEPVRAGALVGLQMADRADQSGAGVDLDQSQDMSGHSPVVITLDGCEPGRGVPALVREINQSIPADEDGFPAASPHHVFYMTPVRVLCPASEPGEVLRSDHVYPPMRDEKAGYGTSVAVLDTGFIRAAAGHCFWLAGITDYDPDPLDKFDLAHLQDTPDGFIDPYTGHGTFIAGVIRRIAPASDVHVRRLDIDLRSIFTQPSYAADIVDEMRMPDHIRHAVWAGQKIISMSAGGPTLDGLPPLSFRGVRQLLERSDAVLVTAAGNDATDVPFWPAAFEWTTGVGALDAPAAGRAAYSNFGVNADVYAPGTDIVNAYACGDYECFQPPDTGTVRHFHGLARWSGTSFATPVVAGLVSARMAARGESAPVALAALLATAAASHSLPGVGPSLAPEYVDLGI